MTVTNALKAHLLATSAVTELVGTRIYADMNPERKTKDKTLPELPAVVIEATEEIPEYTCDGDDGLPRAQVTLHAMAWRRADARALGDVLCDAARAFAGTKSTLEIQGTFVDAERDTVVESEENPDLRGYLRSIQTEIVYERARA